MAAPNSDSEEVPQLSSGPASVEPVQESTPTPKKPDSEKIINALFATLGADGEQAERDRDVAVKDYLLSIAAQFSFVVSYNILVLYDEGRLVKTDADKIYDAVLSFSEKKPLLLVIYSSGGYSDAAYLIGKLCRDHAKEKFIAVVPRQAKSAATLLCCAADEIHMGSLSELGPVDPQIDNLPALGLKNAVEHIAELVKECPASSDMFAKYLHLSLNLNHLGYYERVAESAKQYGDRLLTTHKNNLKAPPEKIAHDLVYGYKDHGFVIDKGEATSIFGDKVIKANTPEYDFGNAIYQAMKMIRSVAEFLNNDFYFIGSLSSKPTFHKRAKRGA